MLRAVRADVTAQTMPRITASAPMMTLFRTTPVSGLLPTIQFGSGEDGRCEALVRRASRR